MARDFLSQHRSAKGDGGGGCMSQHACSNMCLLEVQLGLCLGSEGQLHIQDTFMQTLRVGKSQLYNIDMFVRPQQSNERTNKPHGIQTTKGTRRKQGTKITDNVRGWQKSNERVSYESKRSLNHFVGS